MCVPKRELGSELDISSWIWTSNPNLDLKLPSLVLGWARYAIARDGYDRPRSFDSRSGLQPGILDQRRNSSRCRNRVGEFASQSIGGRGTRTGRAGKTTFRHLLRCVSRCYGGWRWPGQSTCVGAKRTEVGASHQPHDADDSGSSRRAAIPGNYGWRAKHAQLRCADLPTRSVGDRCFCTPNASDPADCKRARVPASNHYWTSTDCCT